MKCSRLFLITATAFTFSTASAFSQAPAYLDLIFNNFSSFDGTSPEKDVYIYFSNGGGATLNPIDITYNGGTGLTYGTFVQSSNTLYNDLSNGIRLGDVTNQTFRITTASSVAVYLTYGNQFTSLAAAPGFFSNSAGGLNVFQNFEITRTGGNGDQGNLTNINYFTAPLSITSFAGTTQLQQTQFNKTTGEIYAALEAISPSSKIVDGGGATLRFVGPSTYPPAQIPPFQSFIPYMEAANASGISNIIQNANAFNSQDNSLNYNFTLNLTTSFTTDGSGNPTALVLNGNISTEIKQNSDGSTSAGPTFDDASITINMTDVDNFNAIVYGQAFGQYLDDVTFGAGWTSLQTYINDSANGINTSGAYNITQNLAIGEITSAILMGFLANTMVVDGTPLNDMPSNEWWKLDPLQAFSEVQSNDDFYNQWGNEIYDASTNGAYSIPYADRLGTGPLVNSVFYDNQYVTSWQVGIYDPVSVVPEPATAVLLGLGVAGLVAGRRRR
ncbi:MAG: PEP-CTERM sorting domain-containing protein [Terrimicrobiaceae bacterium]